MPRNKSLSRKKIMDAAKIEFLEFGYDKASMRDIGKRAGFTQAAIYRHFESKEAMFGALIEPLINEIITVVNKNENDSYLKFTGSKDPAKLFKENNATLIKRLCLNYYDELRLVLCKSQGSKYENFIHNLVLLEQKEMLKALDHLREQGYTVKKCSEMEMHVLLSAYDTALFQPIIHNWNLEDTIKGLDLIEEFFLPGWIKLMGLECLKEQE